MLRTLTDHGEIDAMLIGVLGCGSLGSNLALRLSDKFGDTIKFKLLDFDRIEEENLGNQPWLDVNIGQRKITVLASWMYKKSKTESKLYHKKITKVTELREFGDVDIVVDTFDNNAARKLSLEFCEHGNITAIHCGFAEGVFMSKWDEFPIVENREPGEPVCTRRDLAFLVNIGSTLGAMAIAEYILTRNKRNYLYLERNGGVIL